MTAFPSWPRWAQASLLVIGGVLVAGVLTLALGGGSPGAFLAGVIPGAIAGTVAFFAYRFRPPSGSANPPDGNR